MRYIDFSSVKETIGKIYFGICVFAYAVIGVPILLGMLKKIWCENGSRHYT